MLLFHLGHPTLLTSHHLPSLLLSCLSSVWLSRTATSHATMQNSMRSARLAQERLALSTSVSTDWVGASFTVSYVSHVSLLYAVVELCICTYMLCWPSKLLYVCVVLLPDLLYVLCWPSELLYVLCWPSKLLYVCVVLALRATVACKYCMSVHVTVYTLGMLPFPSMYNNWSGTYMCCECVLYCVTAV